MICNTIGLTTDSFETLYVRGGAEVPEVYGGINYAQPIFYSLKTLTGSTSYSFMGYPEPLKSYEIGGNMVQNGTPQPTSPIYPQECGDRMGNLLYNANIVSGGWLASAGTEPVPVSNPKRCRYNYFFPIASKTVLYDFKDLSVNIVMMDSDGLSLGGTGFVSGAGSVTLLSDTEKISLIIANSDITEGITEDYARSKNISLDYGYTLPLNLNGTTQNLYLQEPLRKIGDYADVVNSDGTVTRRIKKLVLTGEEDWAAHTGIGNWYYVDNIFSPIVNTSAYCDRYKFASYSSAEELTNGQFTFGNPGGITSIRRLIFKDTAQATVTDFKTYLQQHYAAGTPITIWYILSTPTTETITSPAVIPITGSNTLAIDTTLQPSSVSITGHVKPSS